MPVGGSDFGTLPPAGTRLDLANVWADGQWQFRPGSSVAFSSGASLPALTTAPTAPTGGAILYSSSGGVLSFVSSTGQTAVVGGVTQSQTSTVTVANSNTATSLQSYTVPANDPAAGAIYNIYGYGVYSDTGTPTLTFTLYWGGVGGTSLATFTSAALGSGVTNVPFVYEATLTFRSTTSAVANLNMNLGTTAAGASASYVATPSAPTTGLTTTAASALTVGVTWSAASASNTISLLGGFVERVA